MLEVLEVLARAVASYRSHHYPLGELLVLYELVVLGTGRAMGGGDSSVSKILIHPQTHSDILIPDFSYTGELEDILFTNQQESAGV